MTWALTREKKFEEKYIGGKLLVTRVPTTKTRSDDIKRQVYVGDKSVIGSKNKLQDWQSLMAEALILAQDYLY